MGKIPAEGIWTWFKGILGDWGVFQQLIGGLGLYIGNYEFVSNVSTFFDYGRCLYGNGYRHFYFLRCTFNSALNENRDK